LIHTAQNTAEDTQQMFSS